jgi:hypothetical protein
MGFNRVPGTKNTYYHLRIHEKTVALKHSRSGKKVWSIDQICKLANMEFNECTDKIKELTEGITCQKNSRTALNQFVDAVRCGDIKLDGFCPEEQHSSRGGECLKRHIATSKNKGLGTIRTSPEKMDRVVEVWNCTGSMSQVKKQAHVADTTAKKILALRGINV